MLALASRPGGAYVDVQAENQAGVVRGDQVRFTNLDTREVDGLSGTVLVLEGRAVVARYEMSTDTIPVGQTVAVSIFRSVVTSTSVEGRFRDQPANFATRAAIDQIDWGAEQTSEATAP